MWCESHQAHSHSPHPILIRDYSNPFYFVASLWSSMAPCKRDSSAVFCVSLQSWYCHWIFHARFFFWPTTVVVVVPSIPIIGMIEYAEHDLHFFQISSSNHSSLLKYMRCWEFFSNAPLPPPHLPQYIIATQRIMTAAKKIPTTRKTAWAQ